MRAELVQVIEPDSLPGEVLDQYLAEGWYRIGHTMMTCKVLWFDEALTSAIWTRLPLRGHRFKKSHRKLMTRLERRFRIELGPAQIDDEREDLYQRYIAQAKGDRSETLYALRGPREDLFDTWEVRIRDAGRLIAFSWFDLGDEAVQSIVGVYDPRHDRHSLGFASMLFEARFAMGRGLRMYYPGYVLPGSPSMDYKLRLGPVEYWDFTDQSWYPYSDLDPETLPDVRIQRALSTLRAALLRHRIPSRLIENPLFGLPAYHPHLTACLDQPLAVSCLTRARRGRLLLVSWDLDRERYSLLRCTRGWIFSRDSAGVEIPGSRQPMMMIHERLGDYVDVQDAANAVRRAGRRVLS